jgi:Flp pilus assembly protein TadD
MQRVAPEQPSTKYYGAASEFLEGKLPSALQLAQKAVALDPQYAAAQNLLGAIYASLNRADLARQAFQSALQLNPHDSTTYANLGLLELSAARRQEAADFFLEALSIDPASDVARRGLTQARTP